MRLTKMSVEAAFSIAEKITKRLFFIVLCLSLAGCGALSKPQAKENMREFVHPNGLIVRLPETFRATQSGEGFSIEPADGSNDRVRYPTIISVDFHKNGNAPKDEAGVRAKQIGSRAIKYVINREDGGSGGAEYDFSAWESLPNGFISYEQRAQSEHFEPTFEILWQAIENTEVKN